MLQNLLWELTSNPKDRVLESTWNCPYQVYLAGLAIRRNSPELKGLSDLIPSMNRLVYIMRVVVFCESMWDAAVFEE
jgi:hypothetical protein